MTFAAKKEEQPVKTKTRERDSYTKAPGVLERPRRKARTLPGAHSREQQHVHTLFPANKRGNKSGRYRKECGKQGKKIL